MDLADLDLQAAADATAKMWLLHPVTGAKTDIWMQIIGSDGANLRANLRKIRDAAVAQAESEPTEQDAVVILQQARAAAASITDWGEVEFGGQPVPFSLDNAIKLLRDRPWIADQVMAFRDRRANFFKA